MAPKKKAKRKYTRRVIEAPKRKYTRRVEKLDLDDSVPFPIRGETEELKKLKQQIKATVPIMQPRKHSFIIDKKRVHAIASFLRNEFAPMKFTIGKIHDNPSKMRVWRKS